MNILDYFTLDISPVAWACLAAAVLCGLFLVFGFRSRVLSLARRVKSDDEEPIPTSGYPSVSVVVYSQTDDWNLRTLLPQILEQDYPAPLEVIVVNDVNADGTEDVVSALELKYNNLYMTFAPREAHGLSRKKLSITLGLKAARHEVVLLTCGNCRVTGDIWLRLMMRHFIQGKEVVIGHSMLAAIPEGDEDAVPFRLSRAEAFDTLWSDVRSLGAAVAGHPFMGDGCNLAYSRKLFFDNKGFSRTLDLRFGDDDIFVSEVATSQNTAVELSPDSCVLALEARPAAMFRVNKLRRLFTAEFLPRGSYRVMGAWSATSWLFLLSCVGAVALSLPSLTLAAAVVLLIPAVCIPVMSAWKKTARAMGCPRRAFLTQPFLMLAHPFYNLRYKMKSRRERDDNYTWKLNF